MDHQPEYQAPVLEEIGTVRELTLAERGRGRSDQHLWFRYNHGTPGFS